LADRAGNDPGRSAGGQHAMGHRGVDVAGAQGLQRLGERNEAAAGEDDVVDDQDVAVLDLADHAPVAGLLAVVDPLLVADHHRRADRIGELSPFLAETDVRPTDPQSPTSLY